MNIIEIINESPQVAFCISGAVVAVCMALGAFVTYVFGAAPLREQKKIRKRVRKRTLCDDGTPAEYYKNIIADLQNEVEFWKGNCKTAEDRYNKLYQEVEYGGKDQ